MRPDPHALAVRPPLLVDARRVLSSPDDVARRLPGFLEAHRDRARWDAAARLRLYVVANVVAYHVAKSGDAPLADAITRAEIGTLLALAPSGVPVAALGFDPYLNRIRLAAQTGRVDAALDAIDATVRGDRVGPLGYGLDLFTGADRERLHALLRDERALVTWRSGRPTGPAGDLSPALRTELDLRHRLAAPDPPPFALARGDTLKRALHRAVVHVDAADPAPDDPLVAVTRRGLATLPAMSFTCPSTPRQWARTVLRWYAARRPDLVPEAESALARAERRAALAATEALDTTVGPPGPGGGAGVTALAVPLIDLIARASQAHSGALAGVPAEAEMEIAAHVQ